MNTTPKMTVAEENTQTLIDLANRLGYIIIDIDTDTVEPQPRIQIRPASLEDYTPHLYQDWQTGAWTIQTTSYGSLNLDELGKVTEGYERAAAMVSELAHLVSDDLVDYHLTR